MRPVHVELGEGCFSLSPNLRCVMLGTLSKLERIGHTCFMSSGLESFDIHSTVADVGGGVFSECPRYCQVSCCESGRFIVHNSLLLGRFTNICYGPVCQVFDVTIPDSVVELSEMAFDRCVSLRTVTFGASSKLERICDEAFRQASVESICIPDGVVELCRGCFVECTKLRRVTFSAYSNLEHICDFAFFNTGIESITIPDSVVELGKRCLFRCPMLRHIVFGRYSKLERICECALSADITSLTIPDSVVELYYQGFVARVDVQYGPCSSLERLVDPKRLPE